MIIAVYRYIRAPHTTSQRRQEGIVSIILFIFPLIFCFAPNDAVDLDTYIFMGLLALFMCYQCWYFPNRAPIETWIRHRVWLNFSLILIGMLLVSEVLGTIVGRLIK